MTELLLERPASAELSRVHRVAQIALVAPDSTPAEAAELVAALRNAAAGAPGGEIVVVDDCAGPETKSVLAAVRAPFCVLHEGHPRGPAGALAHGASMVTSDVVVLYPPGASPEAGFLIEASRRFADDVGLGLLASPRGGIALGPVTLSFLGGALSLSRFPLPLAPHLADAVARGRFRIEGDLGFQATKGWQPSPMAFPVKFWDPPVQPEVLRHGLNVIGLLEAACGLGEAARRTVRALEKTKVPFATNAFHGHASPPAAFCHRDPGTLPYDTTLLALNPDLLDIFGAFAGVEVWQRRYTIGSWFWELEQLSPTITSHFGMVNELWAATSFLRDALAAATDRPVVTVPVPVEARPQHPTRRREEFGLPEGFCFLTIFDFGSLAERKNCLGAVRAFCDAFRAGEGPVLVVKTMNSSWDPRGRDALRQAVGGRRDVLILDGYLDDEDVSQLTGLCDCYVSLHRSEGFGLTLAEAMAWGRPVVGTNYSGNVDFMDRTNSFPVPYDLVPVDRRFAHVYPPHAKWAEPRLEDASQLLRAVLENARDTAARAAKGRRDIARTNGPEAIGRIMTARLEAIWQRQVRAGTRRAASGGRR